METVTERMKKGIIFGTVLVTAILAVGLAGCGTGVPKTESRTERIDRLYAECLAAGGSFEYNGSLPYWNCEMPQTEK